MLGGVLPLALQVAGLVWREAIGLSAFNQDLSHRGIAGSGERLAALAPATAVFTKLEAVCLNYLTIFESLHSIPPIRTILKDLQSMLELIRWMLTNSLLVVL